MREIKFRGITIQSHMWEYGDLIRDRNGKCFIHFYDCNGFECSYEVIPETIGQYTGLKGKNGKEIYEGDIILFHGNNANHTLKVEHRNSWYLYINIRTGYASQLYGSSEEAFEIIGNIHENPELLKGE